MFLYALWEIIFWYSALAVTICVFILYLIFHNRRHKLLLKFQQLIGKEITRLEGIRKNNIMKKQKKDVFKSTNAMLGALENNLIEMKEKNPLPDIDVELALIENLKLKLKKQPSEYAEYLVYLDEVIAALGTINSTFVTIIGLVK